MLCLGLRRGLRAGPAARCARFRLCGAVQGFSNAPKTKPRLPLPLVYSGPLNDVVRRIKMVSLSSLIGSLVGFSVITVAMESSSEIASIEQVCLAGSAMTLGVSTTAILHWCIAPFVFEMRSDGKHVRATTKSLFLQTIETEFLLENVITKPKGIQPFVSFKANGVPFFVQAEGFRQQGCVLPEGFEIEKFGAKKVSLKT
ncbi:hypothetical protein M885DRAFT_519170 [Pelagophyceae sp. CCMP2097]|nr:hypothetical protein M885DRAFT_519170 [Pelagophyceae sp. CCMP2097]